MLRAIAAVIVGFIVMAVIVIATFAITTSAMGFERVFQPDSYWTTQTFNIIVLTGGFVAAIIGGLVCALIARSRRPAYVLAAITLIMGLATAVTNMNKPDPPTRTGPLTLEEINKHGKEPNWFAFTKTAAAAIGILIGAGLSGRKVPHEPQP